MKLLDQLERASSTEESYFRAQLLREDVARLKALRELASKATSQESFLEHGLRLEWTPGGLRNQQLKTTLEPLLEAFYAADQSGPGADTDTHLLGAWHAFAAQRMDVLVGCLSRVPRPNYD
jgi:hypothetical protein